jgi:beta-phosphoglucomutase-like phosphatase (HAD superfamily)
MKQQKLQALFFDFDGVIVDSNANKTAAFRALFKEYTQDVIAEIVAYHRRHGGVSRVEKIRYAHENIIKQPLTEKELAVWSAEYAQLVVEDVIGVDWIAGAREFLDSNRGSVPMFVISGTPEAELRYIVEQREMTGYFRKIHGSPLKKTVHIRNLLTAYRLNPGRCIFIGDALTDFNAARETGLHFIGIQGEITFPEGTRVLPDCRGLQREIRKTHDYLPGYFLDD